ncbi:MAG: 30S ribosomal protein S20 [Patescibacteria group bacterium]|nr:30S ribosomal protein S20 [Patescibacteria group bacterium]
MAHLKSSKKRERQTERRTKINRKWKDKIATLAKKVRKSEQGKKIEESKEELLINAQKTLDKAASKGVIHKKKAARLKSKWSKKLNSAKSN